MKNYLVLLFLFCLQPAFGQNYSYKKKQSTQRGAVYFFWGYNRSIYSKSNINFTGDGYDFTIHKAKAHDNPDRNIKTYFNPKTISVPQFNIRLGYYYKPQWDISLGYDHMKYVMTDNQQAKLSGSISDSINSVLSGDFDNEIYKITPQAIHYENSNGLNYISVQLSHTKRIYRTKSRKILVQRRLGLGLGGVVTQTDFNWDGQIYNTDLKLTGAGASLHTGLRLDFYNRFFLQSNWSTGFIYLPRLQTIAGTNNYAKHHFVYADWQLLGGVIFYLKTKNGCGSCPDWD